MGSNRDPEGLQPAPGSSPGYRYTIRVRGHLDTQWSESLGGMTITHEANGDSELEGRILDQAALHGVLNKLRDLRIWIVSVQCLGPDLSNASASGNSPDSAP